jgi:hypothetical protein
VKKRTNYDLVTASRGPETRRRTSATCHVASPTPAPRQGTYQLRSGNGQQVPGNATGDVGNVPSAISHTRTSVEQRTRCDQATAGRCPATRRKTWATYRVLSPTAPVDTSNIAAAISHSSRRREQHRDVPQRGA